MICLWVIYSEDIVFHVTTISCVNVSCHVLQFHINKHLLTIKTNVFIIRTLLIYYVTDVQCHNERTHACTHALVPCAGLEFDPKPGPQLAVRVQARNNFSSPAQARKLEFRPDRDCLAHARPGPQVSGPAHTRGPKMGKPAARKPAAR